MPETLQVECQHRQAAGCNLVSTTFYFKQLDISYDQSEILNFFNTTEKHNNGFKAMDSKDALVKLPSVAVWFDSQQIIPAYALYIAIGKHYQQPIHTDAGSRQLAINFPIYNCDTAITNFYEVDESSAKPHKTINNGLPAVEYTITKSKICSFVLTKPTLINIKAPHGVDNNTDFTRYALSFRFHQDPVHLIN